MKSAGLPTSTVSEGKSFCTERSTLATDGDKDPTNPNTFSFPGVPLTYKGYCTSAMKNILISSAVISIGQGLLQIVWTQNII